MSQTKLNLTFQKKSFQNINYTRIIRACVEAVLHEENVTAACEINVLITDDKGIHAINLGSRGVDKPTDVLSFPMFQLEAGNYPVDWQELTDPETGLVPLGDMCISLERAKAQAAEFGHSLRREIGYLTIHSVLHLLGYDHLDEGEQKKQMRAKEEKIAATIANMSRD